MSLQGDRPGAVRAQLAVLPTERRLAALIAHLQRRAAHFLASAAAADAGADVSWLELGFDSLRAVDFRSELAASLRLDLRSTLLFDHTTPHALATHLLAQLGLAEAVLPIEPSGAVGDNEPIAIIGAACRFPGGENLDDYWQLLLEGGDAVASIPAERMDLGPLYDPDPNAPGKIYVREAALLRDIERFDAAFFGISPREAMLLDPNQRLLLEVSWHALEHANLPPSSLQDQQVGVYIGTRSSEYFAALAHRTPADAGSYDQTGHAVSTAAGRLAYTFGFHGPCYALDTACSGSLVAVHIAVRALRARECTVALAGGVNTLFDAVTMAGLCRARMLAPDGRCKSFDAAANGYGRGEGCGIVVLKRLSDAVAGGDRILGVVRGTAINQDGRSGGLTVPHGPSQAAVIRAALADAGLRPDTIDYVEAHGTGTSLGDPIEVGALHEVFAERALPLPIGSVKTNIGHLEAAAGISGLLKTVLALRERTLPATVHFDTPSPHIDWLGSNVEVVTTRTALRGEGALHAGISSFGFSGTNCHVVVASPPAAPHVARGLSPTPKRGGSWLLALQAADAVALRSLAKAHAMALEECKHQGDLAAWCHAAAVGRASLPHRAAFVAADTDSLVARLRAFANGEDHVATASGEAERTAPPLAFLFPGQGAQRAGMGRELHDQEPVFRDALTAAAERLADHLPAPLLQLMFGTASDLLDRTDATQPVLCAYELALLQLFRSVRVRPDHVLGHSVGEFAAAVAAGVMDGGDALQLCAARGRLMVQLCQPGGLVAVLAPEQQWLQVLRELPSLSVAVRNAPANVLVGGDAAALTTLQQRLQALSIESRRLPVSHAFHTATTEPMLAVFEQRVATVRLRAAQCGFLDGRSGAFAGASLATATHWRQQVRDAVHFDRSVATLAATDCRVWIELGPNTMLATLVAANDPAGVRVLSTQPAGRIGRSGWLDTLAALWVRGVDVDLAAANHGTGAARVQLPAYPFQRRRFWIEAPAAAAAPTASPTLLGERRESSLLAPGQTLFVNTVAATRPAWLADHQALGQVLLPAAGMLEMAVAAQAAAGTPLPIAVHDVLLRRRCVLGDQATALELVLTAKADDSTFELKGRDEHGAWRTHCEGRVGPGAAAATIDLVALRQRCPEALAVEQLYERCDALQLQYGPSFRGVRRVWCGDHEALAEVVLPPHLDAAPFFVHPALLDACLHTVVTAMPADTALFLPFGVETLVVHRRGVRALWCHVRVRDPGAHNPSTTSLVADFDLADERGNTIATVRGLQLVPADAAAVQDGAARDLLHHVAWEVAAPATPSPMPARIGIVGWPSLATALRDLLPAGDASLSTIETLPALLATQRPTTLVFLAAPSAEAEPMANQERLFGDALATIQAAQRASTPPRLVLVTFGVQPAMPCPAGSMPHAASLLGLWRTLALEHANMQPLHIDLDALLPHEQVLDHAKQLAAELRTPGDEPEVALRLGQRLVPRLRRGIGRHRLEAPSTPFRVRMRNYGSFEQLGCVAAARRAPGPGEVELAMLAAALNFKDVLHARGLLREFAERDGIHAPSEQPLVFEGCGVVTSTGPGVTHLRVGDHAVVLALDSLASHVTAPANVMFLLPEGVDAVAAAGVPTVFATTEHVLLDLAQVCAGETVLVHAAAGGIGQAAVQVLHHRGCRVLATASPQKQAFVRSLGVEVVGDTRRADFVAATLAATNGRGVDVVLNTLSGDTIGKSVQVLAAGGRFVELGKLGVWSDEQMRAARPDVQFLPFDLGEAMQLDATLLPRLLLRVRAGLAAGHYRPPTATVVPFADVRRAFELLAKGQQVGKVVVRLPQTSQLRADRCYVLTGASGGTAAAIANALVDAGATQLALLARSPIAETLLTRLRDRDCHVVAVRADVADRDSLAAALRHIRRELSPIGGIVHGAGVLADALLTNLDGAAAARALRPKIAGAVWLDELTAGDPLEFFVMMSSMAGTLGNAGQAAYAGANTFLDAFAHWQQARGKPATSIAFGPWSADGTGSEAGMAGRLDERLRSRLQQRGIMFLAATTASRLLVEHRGDAANLAVLSMRWSDWLAPFGASVPRPWAELRPTRSAPSALADSIDLTTHSPEQLQALLPAAVRACIANVLGFAAAEQLPTNVTFRDLGLDSLLAVDAKDRIERMVGQSLPATLLFDFPDLQRLVHHLLQCR